MSVLGQSGWEREANDESDIGEESSDEAGEREMSEAEEEVDGGEGVALRGISIASEKAREGKEPVRRRDGGASIADMMSSLGEVGGEDDVGGEDECCAVRIFLRWRRWRMLRSLIGAAPGCREDEVDEIGCVIDYYYIGAAEAKIPVRCFIR